MTPRLLALSGPLKDSIIPLPNGEVSIGRDPVNLVAISDPALSRRHCVLSPDGDCYQVRDLDSRNGTHVNSSSVKDGLLHHGDHLSVGDSVFLFLMQDEGSIPVQASVEFEEGQAQATAEFRPQDVLYLHPDRILRELPATSRLARNLNVLLKVSRTVHQERSLDKLQDRILELIFDVCPAERGAILLDGQGEKFASIYARNSAGAEGGPLRISRTITRKVFQEGVAVLGTDVQSSGGLSGVESLVGANVRSLLCVPLTVFQSVIGCIYLDTTSSAHRFDDDHLQLAAAIAGICAVALENARHLHWLEQENERLAGEISLEHNMIGDSNPMRELYQLLMRIAPADSTVLIEGESGTGKELAARAIHRNGPRREKAFVAINCAAIPEGLLESELFGHEKGAFTGAASLKRGRLEIADGGTVFLDEIGEMPPALQVKLLRFLQERELERIGSNHPIAVDVRLIAATNKDLTAAVKTGEFRSDLYYRLNVVSLVMPPLRERRDDIPSLTGHFVAKYSKRCAMRPKRVSPEAMACLMNYDWPGNVRELENAIERAVVLAPTDVIRLEDLPEAVLEKDLPAGVNPTRYHIAVRDLKKQLIVNALGESKGNYTEAARALGLHPNYLHRLIRNLNLREELRPSAGARSPNGKPSAAN